jgi:hypothetical protein
VVPDAVIVDDCQLWSTAMTEYPYVVPTASPVSGHDVVPDVTVQTVVGLPGPLVRVTWYWAPESWLPGKVHPTVMVVLPVSVMVGDNGADRLAATAWAGLALSVVIQ